MGKNLAVDLLLMRILDLRRLHDLHLGLGLEILHFQSLDLLLIHLVEVPRIVQVVVRLHEVPNQVVAMVLDVLLTVRSDPT